jgi:hypothetical protein
MDKSIDKITVACRGLACGRYDWPIEPRLENGRLVYPLGVDPRSGWDDRPALLWVYDNRPVVINAFIAYEAAKEDKDALYEAFAEVLNTPAKVVVQEKTLGDDVVSFLELSPAEGEPEGQLACHNLEDYYSTGWSLLRDNSLWLWKTEATSESRRVTRTVLVSITDDEHPIVIRYYDGCNTDPKDVVVLGAGYQLMTYEEYVIRNGEWK